MSLSKQYCTFYLSGYHFGVAVSHVQEIIRSQKMTRVPLAPRVVRGLINLRGQIVVAIDLKKRLGMQADEGENMNIILRTQDGAVSLLVDEIGDVLEVSDEIFEEPPETLKGLARDLIEGAYKLEGKLLLILDAMKTTEVEGASESQMSESISIH